MLGGGGGGSVSGDHTPDMTVSDLASASMLFGEELSEKGSDRSSGGNRWPRQETLALLKIRSDMDVVFRDSSLKGPLWDDISRKMAELGFQRNAKKCKEKFENVYKYHKRTKDGRSTKNEGKSYRFFDQLEALDQHQSSWPPPLPPTTPKPQAPPVVSAPMPVGPTHPPPPPSNVVSHNTTIQPMPSNPTTTTIASMPISINNSSTIASLPPMITTTPSTISFSQPHPINQANMHANLMSNYTSSSSTSSDEELLGMNKKKRKWKEFFEGLMNEVVEKQERLQKKFLDAIERREHDRLVREESWKMQEMARLNQEHEILSQERSMAAAKDAAVIAFLQKISAQQTPGSAPTQTPVAQAQTKLVNDNALQVMSRQQQPPPAAAQQLPLSLPPVPVPMSVSKPKVVKDIVKFDNGENKSSSAASPSRWPKTEVQALINLRTSLDLKYQENVPKGPLWEDISIGMGKIGYNRSAKRCKEKWENINKYFKRMKESNKRRPEDSKTCPYFHLLEALHKEKNKFEQNNQILAPPLMVQPEQQWPLQQPNQGEEDEDENADEFDDDEDGDDEGSGGGYEIVPNKTTNYNNSNSNNNNNSTVLRSNGE